MPGWKPTKRSQRAFSQITNSTFLAWLVSELVQTTHAVHLEKQEKMAISPEPDQSTITNFLQTLTYRWAEIEESPLLEIRALAAGQSADCQKFAWQDIDAASAHVTRLNAEGWNLYACVNPVASNTIGAATDDDIVAAFFCFADADDKNGSAAITNCTPHQPDFFVNTGTVPWLRVHGYWELDEPCRDLSVWRSLQKSIAETLGTDRAVVNPSRIMRLAGTVAYPSQAKINRGYVPEVTTFHTGGLI